MVPKIKKKKASSKLWDDPIVTEIRAVREAHAKKFKFDLDAIFDDLKKYEKHVKEQRVDRGEKRPA